MHSLFISPISKQIDCIYIALQNSRCFNGENILVFFLRKKVLYNGLDAVNSEIFARVLFSLNFAYAKYRENKTLAK